MPNSGPAPSPNAPGRSRAALFLGLGILANLLPGEAAMFLHLPLYLDTLGTMLVAAFFGPWMGALCGLLTSLAWEALHPGVWVWAPVGAVIGLVTGWCARVGLFRHWATTLMAGAILAAAATTSSVPIRLLGGDALYSGESVISSLLIRSGKDVWEAVLSTSYLVEVVDKVSTCVAARLTGLLLTDRFALFGNLRRSGRFRQHGQDPVPGLAVCGGFLSASALYLWFFLNEVVSPTPLPHDHSAHQAFALLAQDGLDSALTTAAVLSPAVAAAGGVLLLVGLILRK